MGKHLTTSLRPRHNAIAHKATRAYLQAELQAQGLNREQARKRARALVWQATHTRTPAASEAVTPEGSPAGDTSSEGLGG